MSELVPALEKIFLSKGGSPDNWKDIIKKVNAKPEE